MRKKTSPTVAVCKHCSSLFETIYPNGHKRQPYYCSRSCSAKSRHKPLEERFWNKVDKSGGPDSCWPFIAHINKNGYGIFHVPDMNRMIGAHRFSYMISIGDQPSGMVVMHTCDNPPCCNPKHLKLGTQSENIADMVAKGRTQDPTGIKNPKVKLTESDVLQIRELYNKGVNRVFLAEIFKITYTNVTYIVKRKGWTHI